MHLNTLVEKKMNKSELSRTARAVQLIRDYGVSVAEAARTIGVHQNAIHQSAGYRLIKQERRAALDAAQAVSNG